ncbi:hypothetical protein L3X38_032435 [Prunus dulcis]|uniref:Integrase catalytic domain-containing protein n=1 Tax=Prunus dulcis TaxID=3755 RepID=A0AAD4YWL9_PRUDU|nr:hypothetical protein L3X38_032435 [Prunus dulcis]
MKKQAAQIQSNCPTCSTIPSTEKSFTISYVEYWRAPYLAFFVKGTLSTNSKLAYKLKKTVKRYFVDGSTLYRKQFNDGYIWILTATEYFTKWVEAIPLQKATGAIVSNFIREYIVCRFGIPYKMVTNNGTPFVNKQVSSTLSGHGIKHRRFTPYFPQGNGQAEAKFVAQSYI